MLYEKPMIIDFGSIVHHTFGGNGGPGNYDDDDDDDGGDGDD